MIFLKNIDIDQVIKKGIFAGVLIALAAFGYLCDKKIGMFLFTFGLINVVLYKAKLFTGTAGFINTKNKEEWVSLFLIIMNNIVGVCIIAFIALFSDLPIIENAKAIVDRRLELGFVRGFFLSIGCGILMTASVNFARKGNDIVHWLPLLTGVPLFILCGFPHCIADSFYLLLTFATGFNHELTIYHLNGVIYYISIVIGNFVGCNLYKIFD